MRIDVLTTFPELFSAEPPAAMAVSMPGRARAAGRLELVATNIRDFTDDKHQKTDDRPFGGGPGMVMMCQPLWDAVHHAEALDPRPARRILLTPQGVTLTQPLVEDLARSERLLLIAGHYEGIDERVIEQLAPEEISIGDYVLSGGELGAMVLIDAVTRLLPGVLGHDESAARDSFAPAPTTDAVGSLLTRRDLQSLGLDAESPPRLLDCPQYTRPREWMGIPVPEVLMSGDHRAVARWRLERMLERTRARRPDLLEAPPADPHGEKPEGKEGA
ncbi:MAG: tRNA (guanosine(37)-N1)-methyltransferase TrmD [Phycisphaerales bacterium]|nr:tRNA (guanosine(37)-N1)-methyltransferase TrmD [Planctomycetota bacterium]MCH8509200.1 tRNA (guanosine(37)-N1)-methyltransferase TrmD [Phycisphaerales bacterium]